MRIAMRTGAMALGFVTTAAAAPSPHRLVIVVGRANDPRVTQQHTAFEPAAAALRERDVLVQDITPEVAWRERPELYVNSHATFEVLLIGKDGGIKLRREEPVAAAEITALIDTMPMRQYEMRR